MPYVALWKDARPYKVLIGNDALIHQIPVHKFPISSLVEGEGKVEYP